MSISEPNRIRAAVVSSYLPRQCGIATFSYDLLEGIKQNYNGISKIKNNCLQVIAVDNSVPVHGYSKEVTFVIREQSLDDYLHAAGFINEIPANVVSLQHEFNLFGGEGGNYIVTFMQKVNKPVVTTLHTILETPSPAQKETLLEICSRSAYITVMTRKAKSLLAEYYGIPGDKVVVIHHGVHDTPFTEASRYKERINMKGKNVILTFGLLDHNKGIEYVIDAMKDVVKEFPEAVFIVLGRTHPGILKTDGEKYRKSLITLVKQKGLSENVVFYNEFVSLDLLKDFLLAADIYITPYLNRERVSSGTLAYALACGKAIISTPYYYAEELLEEDRGRLVPFKSSEAMAEEILLLLKDEKLRNKIRQNAYRYGRQMLWKEVAKSYLKTFEQALS